MTFGLPLQHRLGMGDDGGIGSDERLAVAIGDSGDVIGPPLAADDDGVPLMHFPLLRQLGGHLVLLARLEQLDLLADHLFEPAGLDGADIGGIAPDDAAAGVAQPHRARVHLVERPRQIEIAAQAEPLGGLLAPLVTADRHLAYPHRDDASDDAAIDFEIGAFATACQQAEGPAVAAQPAEPLLDLDGIVGIEPAGKFEDALDLPRHADVRRQVAGGNPRRVATAPDQLQLPFGGQHRLGRAKPAAQFVDGAEGRAAGGAGRPSAAQEQPAGDQRKGSRADHHDGAQHVRRTEVEQFQRTRPDDRQEQDGDGGETGDGETQQAARFGLQVLTEHVGSHRASHGWQEGLTRVADASTEDLGSGRIIKPHDRRFFVFGHGLRWRGQWFAQNRCNPADWCL